MCCGLELVVADSWEEFLALEGDLASCGAIHVGDYGDKAAMHAAAKDLLETGLPPDVNYYRDQESGAETLSLWYYPH